MRVRILIVIVLTLAAVWGVHAWNKRLYNEGYSKGGGAVLREWQAADNKRLKDEAEALALAQKASREAETSKQKEAERIANEQAQREQASRAALAAATDRNRSLLTTIAQLNSDAAARLSSPSAQSCTTADIDAAARARTALGECSSEYTAVAGVADQLTDKVSGLQDYVRSVTKSAQGGAADGF